MLIEDFNEWLTEPLNSEKAMDLGVAECFNLFYQDHTQGRSIRRNMEELASQIYELQVCAEGIIEEVM